MEPVTAAEDGAFQVDAYLDQLLGAGAPRPRDLATDDELDAELERTVGLVHRALARFHPSFAFEERLAVRLRGDADAPFAGDVLDFRVVPFAAPTAAERRARGLLVGGAIASGVSIASVSLAGAAILVRRRARPQLRASRLRHRAEVSL
ncbi:MAG: hypothetical protein QOH61_65 [Chloroflexota bacterium]|nr:hypothetical protein [Chloroflexota bacterium]